MCFREETVRVLGTKLLVSPLIVLGIEFSLIWHLDHNLLPFLSFYLLSLELAAFYKTAQNLKVFTESFYLG